MTKRILVLDDRQDDRDLIRAVLSHAGYEVEVVADPSKALSVAEEQRFDLFVTDIVMPRMDGYELVKRLRQASANSDTPVVFYSAMYLTEEIKVLADAVGVADVISKPADPAMILDVIERALGAPHPARGDLTDDDFNREHMRVVSSKLFQKVTELEEADRIRARLLDRLIVAQEEERKRIAADIHDDTVQAMFAVGVRLQMLAASLQNDSDKATISQTAETVKGAIARLRRLIFDLRPPMLDSGGLASALKIYLGELEKDHGISFEFHHTHEDRLGPAAGLLLYRVAQEALRNVVKHSGARRVIVRLEASGTFLELSIEDDGKGFTALSLEDLPGHLGIAAMMERLESANGTCEIESTPGLGTTVSFRLPFTSAQAGHTAASVA